jgi:hypothetical protein
MERIDGKTWQELDRAYIAVRSDALGFLGTRHVVAVLPAYLSSLIEEGVWSPAADTLMLLLAKPGQRKDRAQARPIRGAGRCAHPGAGDWQRGPLALEAVCATSRRGPAPVP